LNILVADSGSTKTEWILIGDTLESEPFYSEGLNPYFKTESQIHEVIEREVQPKIEEINIDKIFFYGAGCSSESNCDIVKKSIADTFGSSDVYIQSDLLAAAIACFGRSPGVACILGTGSNACIYNGERIVDQIPSLGFTLGDEGSGGYFGKKILRSYFYNQMPDDLKTALNQKFDMKLDSILEQVYHRSTPNRFVASFAYVLAEYSDHPFIHQIVEEGFSDFINHQLAYFKDLSGMKLGFVGSIAAIHHTILREVLQRKGLQPDVIIQKPIKRLTRFHLRYSNN